MTAYVALLRSVNVGGRSIPMADLRTLFLGLGYEDARTYIQSGNVVFSGEAPPEGLETAIRERFGIDIRVLLRTQADLAAMHQGNPFVGRGLDESKLHVTFLERTPSTKVGEVESGRDEYSVRGSEVYLYCPDGYGRTKLNNTFFERRLKVTATTRNWRTIGMLSDLMAPLGG